MQVLGRLIVDQQYIYRYLLISPYKPRGHHQHEKKK
jgi:hypothetical protein